MIPLSLIWPISKWVGEIGEGFFSWMLRAMENRQLKDIKGRAWYWTESSGLGRGGAKHYVFQGVSPRSASGSSIFLLKQNSKGGGEGPLSHHHEAPWKIYCLATLLLCHWLKGLIVLLHRWKDHNPECSPQLAAQSYACLVRSKSHCVQWDFQENVHRTTTLITVCNCRESLLCNIPRQVQFPRSCREMSPPWRSFGHDRRTVPGLERWNECLQCRLAGRPQRSIPHLQKTSQLWGQPAGGANSVPSCQSDRVSSFPLPLWCHLLHW